MRNPEEILQLSRDHLLSYAMLMMSGYQAPPHIKRIAGCLEGVASGKIKRLIITVPPRHGKSMLCSQFFPAWYMGNNPSKFLISATYGQDLSDDFGRKVRDQLDEPLFKAVFPDCALRSDSKAAARFATTQGGTYFGLGSMGAITGRGADCLAGDTMVMTEAGAIDIESLVQLSCKPKVKAYNHDTGKAEYRNIIAWAKYPNRPVYSVRTHSGRVITATGDHKIFTVDSGYTAVARVKVGQKVIAHRHNLSSLREAGAKENLRNTESNQARAQGFLLQSRMLESPSCDKEQTEMHGLRDSCSEKDSQEMRPMRNSAKAIAAKVYRKALSYLQDIILACKYSQNLLRQGLLQQSAFYADGWQGEFSLQGRNELFQAIRFNAPADSDKGREQVCELRQGHQPSHAPHQRKSSGQSGRELSHSVQFVPHNASQIEYDTISVVEKLHGEGVPVYDIQVEGLSNFFANGVLVHNCLFIDDPIKNREEADSSTYRDKLWDWFRSVAYTRLMPGGSVVVIMTRWHEDDLVGRILASEGASNWEVINLPALDSDNVPLWPSQYNVAALNDIRQTVGEYDWQCLYQQNPIPHEGIIIRAAWMKTGLANAYTAKFMAVDPAIGQKETNDETAITCAGISEGDPAPITEIETIHGHYDFATTLSLIQAMYYKHKPAMIGVEDVAYQKALIQELARLGLPVAPLSAIKDKVARAMSVSHFFAQGRVSVNTADLRTQLLRFRGGGERNDMSDAFFHVLGMVRDYTEQRNLPATTPQDRFKNLSSADMWRIQTMEHRKKEILGDQGIQEFSKSNGSIDADYY